MTPTGPTRRRLSRPLLTLGTATVLFAAGLAAPATATAASVLVVGAPGPNCPGAQYSTIQDAVDAASAGDTVRVCAGTYPDPVTVGKTLTFRGAQAGVDARAGRTDAARESVVSAPSGIDVSSGTGGVTVDGFTVRDSLDDGIDAFSGGSGWTFVNNVVTGNRYGINFQSPSGAATLVRHNRFTDNNRPSGGTGVFISNGPADNTSITQNRFSGHDEADVNTAGSTADHSSGLSITGNASVNSATFAVLVNADGTPVTGNTVQRTGGTAPQGSGIFVGAGTTGVQISGNVISGGDATGIRVTNLFGPDASTGLNVRQNIIQNRQTGIDVSDLASGTFTSNQISRSTADGIHVNAPGTPGLNSGLVFRSNIVLRSANLDATDLTTGPGTAGTSNTWTSNICAKRSPAGICVA